jgi:hypothetical protein
MPAAAASGWFMNVRMFQGSASTASVTSPSRTTSAPIGTPPPIPLPATSRSGATSNSSHAHIAPQRPMPVWISSTISSTPRSRQARWTSR